MSGIIHPWPYAAKADIRFEFDVDRLRMYLTFPFPMDQDVIPPVAAWVIRVDGVDKTPGVTSWRDDFTLNLTVFNIPVHPARVMCTFLGPLDTLRTTWVKQWEPWHRIICQDVPYEWEHVLDVDVDNARVTINGVLALSSMTVSDGLAQSPDVSGVNIVWLDCSAGDIEIQSLLGGINDQVIYLAKLCAAVQDVTLKHNGITPFGKLFLHAGVDETLRGEYGGWTLVCNGYNWFDVSHAKHV